MKVLAVETATIAGSAAICDDTSGLIGEFKINVKVAHAERLMPSIQWLLESSRIPIEEIDAFAISIGPGSFTGLRIGLSTVKGLAYATKKPVVAVPTLDAFARIVPFSAYQICPLLDARKDEVFAGLYAWDEHTMIKIMQERAIRPDDLVKEITEKTVFIGDGILRYGDMITDLCGDNAIFPPLSIRTPSAATVGDIALEKMKQGDYADPVSLTPFYIRKSEAELNWKG